TPPVGALFVTGQFAVFGAQAISRPSFQGMFELKHLALAPTRQSERNVNGLVWRFTLGQPRQAFRGVRRRWPPVRAATGTPRAPVAPSIQVRSGGAGVRR